MAFVQDQEECTIESNVRLVHCVVELCALVGASVFCSRVFFIPCAGGFRADRLCSSRKDRKSVV